MERSIFDRSRARRLPFEHSRQATAVRFRAGTTARRRIGGARRAPHRVRVSGAHHIGPLTVSTIDRRGLRGDVRAGRRRSHSPGRYRTLDRQSNRTTPSRGEGDQVRGGKSSVDGMGQGQGVAAQVADHGHHQRGDSRSTGASSKPIVGLKAGRHRAMAKAGNPEIQPGVSVFVGAGTEVIAERLIMTRRRHRCAHSSDLPQQVEDALMSGVTTMIGGGTGPAAGTAATTCHARSLRISRACIRPSKICDEFPVCSARAMPACRSAQGADTLRGDGIEAA